MTKTERSEDRDALLEQYRAYVRDAEWRFREIRRIAKEVQQLLAEGPPSQRLRRR